MADTDKNSDATAERRVDRGLREVVELVIIELRRRGIVEAEIQTFLSRRRNRERKKLNI